MNVAAEGRRTYRKSELLGEVFDETMNKVIRRIVALMNKRIFAIEKLDAALALAELREVRIILPKLRARGSHVGQELTGVGKVQVAHCRRQHDDVAGRLEIAEN